MSLKTLVSSVDEFVLKFLRENVKPKMSVDSLIKAFSSDEVQDSLGDTVKLNMPKPKVRKARKPKDPNAPVRAKSAYMFFTMAKREEVKKKNPNKKITELSKIFGQLWKDISKDEKKIYEDQAKEDKARYEAEKPAKVADPNKPPPKPKTAFLFFAKEMRPKVMKENPDAKLGDISKELGTLWTNDYKSTDAGKKWRDMAEQAKQEYEEAKSTWEEEHPDLVKEKKEKKSKKAKEKEEKEEKPKGPKAKKPVEESKEEEEEKPKKSKEPEKKEVKEEKSKDPKGSKKPKAKEPVEEPEPELEEEPEEPKVVVSKAVLKFTEENRKKIQEKNPEWTDSQVSEELHKKWSKLTAQQRAKYDK